MSTLFSLADKTILLTGGYGHLGRAIARGLADHGARVVVLGRSAEKFAAALGDATSVGFEPCDVADTASVRAALRRVADATGRLDVLINNAAFVRGNDPEALTDEDWAYSVDGTLGSVHRCLREAIPYFKERRGGKVINVSSMYGLVSPHFEIYDGNPAQLNPAHYGAAKAGVIQLTRYYAAYLARYGVNVNCVTPGPFPGAAAQRDPAFLARLEALNPLGRIGRPEDVVGAFVYLASAASDYVTGHNLVVDGGWTAW